MDTRRIAQAFSGHRFSEVYEHLADDVRWVLPGRGPIEGRTDVVAACETAAAAMAELAGIELVRSISVADDQRAAVDTITRYTSGDGSASIVSSADIYEFDDRGKLATITSYAVELDG